MVDLYLSRSRRPTSALTGSILESLSPPVAADEVGTPATITTNAAIAAELRIMSPPVAARSLHGERIFQTRQYAPREHTLGLQQRHDRGTGGRRVQGQGEHVSCFRPIK